MAEALLSPRYSISQEVLDFWFPAGANQEARMEWFKKDEAFDKLILDKFGSLIDDALEGKLLPTWGNDLPTITALIILLDQFPRNVFRGNAKSYAGSEQAISLTKSLISSGKLNDAPTVHHKAFLLIPLMHSEDIEDQKLSIIEYEKLGDVTYIKFAQDHIDEITKFGRFPARNESLGRESTPAEVEFLAAHAAGWAAAAAPAAEAAVTSSDAA